MGAEARSRRVLPSGPVFSVHSSPRFPVLPLCGLFVQYLGTGRCWGATGRPRVKKIPMEGGAPGRPPSLSGTGTPHRSLQLLRADVPKLVVREVVGPVCCTNSRARLLLDPRPRRLATKPAQAPRRTARDQPAWGSPSGVPSGCGPRATGAAAQGAGARAGRGPLPPRGGAAPDAAGPSSPAPRCPASTPPSRPLR